MRAMTRHSSLNWADRIKLIRLEPRPRNLCFAIASRAPYGTQQTILFLGRKNGTARSGPKSMTDRGSSLVAKSMRAVGIVSSLLLLFTIWYSVASNYGDHAVSGTYTYKESAETSILILREDHSFQQALSRSGNIHHTEGKWRRLGQGGIAFSREFQEVSGQQLGPGGQYFGEVKKKFTLFTFIALDPQLGGPIFHKRFPLSL
jgi:hypothetical protein